MCTEDIEVEIPKDKKISFKKGEIIYVPLYSIQHDEEFYDEPKKFKPERFSAENGGVKAYKDRFVFFPFGDGPRICVGQRFAIMQAKIAITSLIRKFKMTVNEKTPEKPVVHPRALVYYPMGSYWLNLNEIADNEE